MHTFLVTGYRKRDPQTRKDDNEKNRCILLLFNLVLVFTGQMRSVGFFLKRLTTQELISSSLLK